MRDAVCGQLRDLTTPESHAGFRTCAWRGLAEVTLWLLPSSTMRLGTHHPYVLAEVTLSSLPTFTTRLGTQTWEILVLDYREYQYFDLAVTIIYQAMSITMSFLMYLGEVRDPCCQIHFRFRHDGGGPIQFCNWYFLYLVAMWGGKDMLELKTSWNASAQHFLLLILLFFTFIFLWSLLSITVWYFYLQ